MAHITYSMGTSHVFLKFLVSYISVSFAQCFRSIIFCWWWTLSFVFQFHQPARNVLFDAHYHTPFTKKSRNNRRYPHVLLRVICSLTLLSSLTRWAMTSRGVIAQRVKLLHTVILIAHRHISFHELLWPSSLCEFCSFFVSILFSFFSILRSFHSLRRSLTVMELLS